MFEVRPEKILVLECLGPPESDWNLQTFQVNRFGCVGGRKHNPEDNLNNKETVLFKDITVSRRHFEVTALQHFSPLLKLCKLKIKYFPLPFRVCAVQITNTTDIATANSVFSIRDLGSAGGTFIRIPHGKRKQLHPGTSLFHCAFNAFFLFL